MMRLGAETTESSFHDPSESAPARRHSADMLSLPNQSTHANLNDPDGKASPQHDYVLHMDCTVRANTLSLLARRVWDALHHTTDDLLAVAIDDSCRLLSVNERRTALIGQF